MIDNKFGIVKHEIYDEYQLSVVVKQENIFAALALMQLNDFKELSILTAVDWLDRNVFEVVYILFSYTHNQQLILKTEINRDNPEIVSVMNLWEVAETYERDVHEFFGIKFLGNPSLKPFFLHNSNFSKSFSDLSSFIAFTKTAVNFLSLTPVNSPLRP